MLVFSFGKSKRYSVELRTVGGCMSIIFKGMDVDRSKREVHSFLF